MIRPAIRSIGTATPSGFVSQRDVAEIACASIDDPDRGRVVRALFRRAGVKTRHSVLADPHGDQHFYRTAPHPDPSTHERMTQYQRHASDLAIRAARDAFERAGDDPATITHIVTASCTGFDAPGADQDLIRTLGLPPYTRRTNIGFMGCHAAINALAVADAFVRADPDARVLVCCVELCSLHLARTDDPQRHVAHALFADGAAAAIIANSQGPAPRIVRTDAVLFPDSADQMTWRIGDHGFEMTLAPSVPTTLADRVPGWIRSFLGREGLTPDDITHWALHPGGPRVLSALRDALGLDPAADAHARAILQTHGNMSSATILFILDAILRSPHQTPQTPILALAFGPGLAGESLLLAHH